MGFTSDLAKRLSQHNSRKVRSTKSRVPYELVYTEEYANKIDARKRELEIKNNWRIKQDIIKQINTKMVLSS